MRTMRKQNFPIGIAILVTTIFYTFILFSAYSSSEAMRQSLRAEFPFDAAFNRPLSAEETKKIEEVEALAAVSTLGKPESAMTGDAVLVHRAVDAVYYSLMGDDFFYEGRAPRGEGEIAISAGLCAERGIRIGDAIEVKFGDRMVDGKVIPEEATWSGAEAFREKRDCRYVVSGIVRNEYNAEAGIHVTYAPFDAHTTAEKTVVRFHDFRRAYEARKELVEHIYTATGSGDLHLNFDKHWIHHYHLGEETQSFLDRYGPAIVSGLGLLLGILFFVFFIKNVFAVWGLEKIRKLSMYKSIGSTDGQIYRLLLKEAMQLAVAPVLAGHILGIGLGVLLSDRMAAEGGRSFYYHPLISLGVVGVTLTILLLAIRAPAKRIAQIPIIEGIRGNVKMHSSKKKRRSDLWKELARNNRTVLRAQRYVSAVGIALLAALCLVYGLATYERVRFSYDSEYNVEVSYLANGTKYPGILRRLQEEVPHERGYLQAQKYIRITLDAPLSDAARAAKLDEVMQNSGGVEGLIVGLDPAAFQEIGGKPGEVLLYNRTQKDPKAPIADAEWIPLFQEVDHIDYDISEEEHALQQTVPVRLVNELPRQYVHRIFPLQVRMFTDLDTFMRLRGNFVEAYRQAQVDVPAGEYGLFLKVPKDREAAVKGEINRRLKRHIAYDESYSVRTKGEQDFFESEDLKALLWMMGALGTLVALINFSNAYASVKSGILHRSREIGILRSQGMEEADIRRRMVREYAKEQLHSLIVAVGITAVMMLYVHLFSGNYPLSIQIKYFRWDLFALFAALIYGINLMIFRSEVDKPLRSSILSLIR